MIPNVNLRPYVNYKNAVLGTRIDVDGFPRRGKYQCVDLFKDYCKKVLGLEYNKVGNAKQIWTNKYKIFDSTRECIQGTDNIMQGDIIVSIMGQYGHVAIVDSIVGGEIFVLEQNGTGVHSGNGKGGNVVRVKGYDPSFRKGVRRCGKIFQNLQSERAYIDNKLKITNFNKDATLNYKDSIRYQA